jgi:hypothetical protein
MIGKLQLVTTVTRGFCTRNKATKMKGILFFLVKNLKSNQQLNFFIMGEKLCPSHTSWAMIWQ